MNLVHALIQPTVLEIRQVHLDAVWMDLIAEHPAKTVKIRCRIWTLALALSGASE